MVICPDCGKDVKEAKFCSNCGALLPEAGEAPVEAQQEAAEEDTSSVEDVVDVTPSSVEDEAPAEDVIEVVPSSVEDVAEVVPSSVEEIEDVNVEEEPAAEDEIEINANIKSKFCTNCGEQVAFGTAFCPNCGSKLNQEEEMPKTKFCQNCGDKIDINAEICPHCGVRVANFRAAEEKNVLLAAILSFLFPGLGHLYLGLTKKGISFIIAYIISAILIFLLIGIVLVIIVWLWALIDSIKSTEAINRGEFVEDKLF